MMDTIKVEGVLAGGRAGRTAGIALAAWALLLAGGVAARAASLTLLSPYESSRWGEEAAVLLAGPEDHRVAVRLGRRQPKFAPVRRYARELELAALCREGRCRKALTIPGRLERVPIRAGLDFSPSGADVAATAIALWTGKKLDLDPLTAPPNAALVQGFFEAERGNFTAARAFFLRAQGSAEPEVSRQALLQTLLAEHRLGLPPRPVPPLLIQDEKRGSVAAFLQAHQLASSNPFRARQLLNGVRESSPIRPQAEMLAAALAPGAKTELTRELGEPGPAEVLLAGHLLRLPQLTTQELREIDTDAILRLAGPAKAPWTLLELGLRFSRAGLRERANSACYSAARAAAAAGDGEAFREAFDCALDNLPPDASRERVGELDRLFAVEPGNAKDRQRFAASHRLTARLLESDPRRALDRAKLDAAELDPSDADLRAANLEHQAASLARLGRLGEAAGLLLEDGNRLYRSRPEEYKRFAHNPKFAAAQLPGIGPRWGAQLLFLAAGEEPAQAAAWTISAARKLAEDGTRLDDCLRELDALASPDPAAGFVKAVCLRKSGKTAEAFHAAAAAAAKAPRCSPLAKDAALEAMAAAYGAPDARQLHGKLVPVLFALPGCVGEGALSRREADKLIQDLDEVQVSTGQSFRDDAYTLLKHFSQRGDEIGVLAKIKTAGNLIRTAAGADSKKLMEAAALLEGVERPAALALLAKAYAELGRRGDEARAYARLRALEPDKYALAALDAQIREAEALFGSGDYARGLAVVEQALSVIGPGEGYARQASDALYLRGRLLHQLGFPGRGAEDLEQSLRIAGREEAGSALMEMYFRAGRHRPAITTYASITAPSIRDRMYYRLAQIYAGEDIAGAKAGIADLLTELDCGKFSGDAANACRRERETIEKESREASVIEELIRDAQGG